MIVWQGAGFAGVLVPVIFVLLGNFGLDKAFGDGYYASHAWAPASMLIAAALVVWWFGKRLENRPGKELIDPQTQQKVVLKEKHTLFWIPLHYFAIVLAGLAILMPFVK
jgi:hypothetical protein